MGEGRVWIAAVVNRTPLAQMHMQMCMRVRMRKRAWAVAVWGKGVSGCCIWEGARTGDA